MQIKGITLNWLTEAYLECALWADAPESNAASIHDFTKADLARAVADCERFLDSLTSEERDAVNSCPSQAGHDLWLNRNGHGCGFWDRETWGGLKDSLSAKAKALGRCELWFTKSGKPRFF